MARQAINLGALPNGVGGDTTRSANTKINAMMQELYAATNGLGTTGNYDVLPVTKGGTGGADAASARVGLGLGSASNANIGTAPGQVMTVGTGGLYGSPSNVPVLVDLYNLNRRSLEMGQYGLVNGARIPGAQSDYGLALGIQGAGSEWRHILQFSTEGDVYDVSLTNPSTGGQWRIAKFYTTLNTTRAADGTLKAI